MAEIEQRDTTPARRDWLTRWFDDFPLPRWWPDASRWGRWEGMEPLRVEEFQENGTLVVRAEMPGMDPDKDVVIDVIDHTLRIRAERRQESKVDEKNGYRTEFQYGSFSRTLSLPAGATDKDVKATYKDGILEVRLPIDRAQAEERKIPIERT
jgi:HSP20 family protein